MTSISAARATAFVAGCVLLGFGASPALAAHRSPTLDPARALIDGPSDTVQSVDGMSIARDGTGGLVYSKTVDGVAHVFLSPLVGGAFQAPRQVDAGLPGPSSEPVVAAANGALLVAFINGGRLYVAQATTPAGLGGPVAIVDGATHPSLAISPSGEGYLAYTATAGGRDAVGFAYWAGGQWQLGAAPLDATTADAGVGTGRPRVAACGDGIGIAVWGEAGHVFARRLIDTTPSVQTLQADPPAVGSDPEVSATSPAVSCVGYSTFAPVAFTEAVAHGAQTQTRVVVARLRAERFDPPAAADGLAAGADDAAQPAVAVTEYGFGNVTSTSAGGHQVTAALLGRSAKFGKVVRLDSLPNAAAPDAVPGVAGLIETFVAWQQTPGRAGPAEIRMRDAPDGADFEGEQVLSDPASGPTDADDGLVTGGDLSGDAAVAWLQRAPAGNEIVAAQLYQRPGGFAPALPFRYARTLTPGVQWSAAKELWGPVSYAVTIDRRPIATTTATAATAPFRLHQGRHVVRVTATNQAGLSTGTRQAKVFVDTLKPRSSVTVSGHRVARSRLTIRIHSRDRVGRGLSRTTASGVNRVVLRWGDRQTTRRGDVSRSRHAYRRPGTYHLVVLAYDRAGNRTTVKRTLRIAAASRTTGHDRRGRR